MPLIGAFRAIPMRCIGSIDLPCHSLRAHPGPAREYGIPCQFLPYRYIFFLVAIKRYKRNPGVTIGTNPDDM